MANEVNILVTATDRASAVLNKATGGVKGLSSTFQNLTGISLGAAGAITGVVAAIKSSIDFTVKYADQVQNLARNIGATTQEASRLIQVSDDVKVSVEQLGTGLKAAITRGYEPTIEGLGEMSDAYLAIQDPIARSKYLIDTFGRSGLEMARLMELGSAGIKSMGENAKMVLTPADIDRMNKFYLATDDLNDSFDQLKVTIGLTAAGPLTQFFQTMSNGIQTMGEVDLVGTNFMMNLHDILYNTGGAESATNQWMESMRNAAIPVDSWAASWKQAGDAASNAGVQTDSAVTEVQTALDRLNGMDTNLSGKIAGMLDKEAFAQAGGDAVQAYVDQINTAFANGQITEAQWKTMTEGAYVAAQQVDVALGTITGDEAAANISRTLNVSLAAASQMVKDTATNIDAIKSKDVYITVTTYYRSIYVTDKNYSPRSEGDAFGGSYRMNSFGNSFKIPAAFGFEGFPTPMGTASGGERMTITPEGENQEIDLSQRTIQKLALAMRDIGLTSV